MIKRLPRSTIVCGLITGHFILGMLSLGRGEFNHVFPVHAWDMFSRVPGETVEYDLRVHRYGGADLPAPVFLLEEGLLREDQIVLARTLVQNWGEALDEGDTGRAEANRLLIEKDYLRGPWRYDLVARKANPLARVRGQGFVETTVVSGEGGGGHALP